MEYRDRLIRSKGHRDIVRQKSLEYFCGIKCVVKNHQFIVDDTTAKSMAEALATKSPGLMKRTLGNSIEEASKESLESPVETFIEEWNEAISSSLGTETTLYDLLVSKDTKDIKKLRESIKESRLNQFGLEIDSYIRLIQTIALCTIPDDGLRARHLTNSHSRSSNSKVGLFSLSVNILNTFANQEPGLSMLRNGVLSENNDASPIDTYLSRLQISETAKNALNIIISIVDNEEITKTRLYNLNSLETFKKEDTSEELKLHLLTWEILPHKCDDVEEVKDFLRKKAKSLAKTAKAKADFEQRFDDSRLDTIFAIAHQEATKGRAVEIYISSAFNNSQEFYVAVEFEHHEEPDIKIVIADNPMSGNAIYMVDEQYTKQDENGENYKWKKVLGASKKIARQRGARRRFHVGEWQKLANHFCIHGVGKMTIRGFNIELDTTVTEEDILPTIKDTSEDLPDTITPSTTTHDVLDEKNMTHPTAQANKDKTKNVKPDIKQALQNIAAMREAIDKIYKDIIDKE